MATQHETIAPAWSVRLATDLLASDENAKRLLAGLTKEQLNWQPAPISWSVGQCLEHLCLMNEVYLPPISAAFKEKPDSPVEQITPGWFGGWFIRNFAEPTSGSRRVGAPAKIRPASNVEVSVLDRFLSGNQSCRDIIVRARSKNVNRIRFWNPFIPGLRFTVGTGLEIIVRHERRHLLQAERVREAVNFPHQLSFLAPCDRSCWHFARPRVSLWERGFEGSGEGRSFSSQQHRKERYSLSISN